MLSDSQFESSISFLKSYRDALSCVEEIAERQQAYAHYQSQAGAMVDAMQKNQVYHPNCFDHFCRLKSRRPTSKLERKQQVSKWPRHIKWWTPCGQRRDLAERRPGKILSPN